MPAPSSRFETAQRLHGSSTRVRLRVPGRHRDVRWFDETASRLRTQPGVVGVRYSPGTATLTIQLDPSHRKPTPDPLAALRRVGINVRTTDPAVDAGHGGRQPTRPRPDPGPDPAVLRLGLLQTTRIDRRQLALAVFLLLLVRHLWRSGWLLPALALGWFLMESLPSLRASLPSLRRPPADPR
jgi:hypothetical protein